MAALDNCEPEIILALEKASWQILEKPYIIRLKRRTVLADFSAQRMIEGKIEQVIVVEVKCFTKPHSDLQEFYTAVGQYQFYLTSLAHIQIDYPVYLALPLEAYERLLLEPTFEETFEYAGIQLLIVNWVTGELLWKP